jgi:ubiquinone/menaquinone biosynthesis C-methylase UbiE
MSASLHDAHFQDCVLAFVSGRERLRVLDLGCGSGTWLALVASVGCDVAGIDLSVEAIAAARNLLEADLRVGRAEQLPWPDAVFDRVMCINALHHFEVPARALDEAFRVLRPGGRLLSIGLDPHERVGRWFVYEYFPETLAVDFERFPSRRQREAWLTDTGFVNPLVKVASHVAMVFPVDQAVRDRAFEPAFTSGLGLLSPDQYEAGLRRIADARRCNPHLELDVDLMLYATEATRPL